VENAGQVTEASEAAPAGGEEARGSVGGGRLLVGRGAATGTG
jgi:hypothetical protein